MTNRVRNENNDSITWIGPDCINAAGITHDSIQDIENVQEILRTRPAGVLNKEVAYLSNLLKEEITANKVSLSSFQNKTEKTGENAAKVSNPAEAVAKYHIANFEVPSL